MAKRFIFFGIISFIVLLLGALVACTQRTVRINYYATDGGYIDGIMEQRIAVGEYGLRVIAIANEDYEFIKWSDGVTFAMRQEKDVKKNLSLTAEFARKRFALTYKADGNGTLQGEANQTVCRGENGTAVTAIPNEGYAFVKWSDGVTEAMRLDENINSQLSVKALFIQTFTLTYKTDGNGTLQGVANQTVCRGENGTAVKAIPNEGYEFVKWSDGITQATRLDIDVKSGLSITAEFAAKTYTVTYAISGNGALQGIRNQTVTYGENCTAVTAIPNEGYEFIKWSDGVTDVTRQEINVSGSLSLTAIFERKVYQVTYLSKGIGYIIGKVNQTVCYGDNATSVKARPDYEFATFLGWSDGVRELERIDKNVRSDITVTAYFGLLVEYEVADARGGTIVGETRQVLWEPGACEMVTAVPDEGYVFAGWSDATTDASRCDYMDGRRQIRTYVAYFTPTEKKFSLDYGEGNGIPAVREMTISREQIETVRFIVPVREGYTFCGWYADRDYRIKIANEEGRYMYGYAIFYLENDTLYARWQKADEENDPHKVLLVFVDHVHGMIYSNVRGEDAEVEYRMGALDYEATMWWSGKFTDILNEWFQGEVTFEVDSYYTVRTVTDGFEGGRIFGMIDTSLFADGIEEVARLAQRYHNTITTVGYGDYQSEFHVKSVAGVANAKNACVYLDNYWVCDVEYRYPLQDEYLARWKKGQMKLTELPISTYLHEFAHTAELSVQSEAVRAYHDVIYSDTGDNMELTRKYLLNQVYSDGVSCGIPMEYWKHQTDVRVSYTDLPVNQRQAGDIVIVGTGNTKMGYIPYGSDFSVQAVPLAGYRFVKWSDGVTTAIREDKNIISYLYVKAIFEKIN